MLDNINLSFLDREQILLIAKALSSPTRYDILTMIAKQSYNITELSNKLNQPLSSTRADLNVLEEAGLVRLTKVYAKTGKSIIAYRTFDKIFFDFYPEVDQNDIFTYDYTLPIGSYVSTIDVKSPCGMASNTSVLGNDNDESIFYSPERFNAQLIWLTSGFLEYRIKRPSTNKKIKSIEICFEACSEAPLYNNNFKSDISLCINDVHLGTWTCPGDFGGNRGQFTPEFWAINKSQYGILTHWIVDQSRSTINDEFLSEKKISDINFDTLPYITIKIGVDKKAKYCGGMNLFGKGFGNHPTDLTIKIRT